MVFDYAIQCACTLRLNFSVRDCELVQCVVVFDNAIRVQVFLKRVWFTVISCW